MFFCSVCLSLSLVLTFAYTRCPASSRICLSLQPSPEVTGAYLHTQYFMGVEDLDSGLHDAQQAFYSLDIFPDHTRYFLCLCLCYLCLCCSGYDHIWLETSESNSVLIQLPSFALRHNKNLKIRIVNHPVEHRNSFTSTQMKNNQAVI